MITPTLKHLRYLVALYDHRHFSRAAEICNVTQSTLSGGIQDLEALLNLTLFERTRKKVVPTPAADDLAAHARAVLRQSEEFMEAAAMHRDPYAEPLSLGVIPTIAPFLLPAVLPLLREAYPDLRLTLREDQTARLLARLAEGELDFLILAFPYDTPGVERQVFLSDRFWVACPPDHPLADRAEVDPEEIPRDQLLLLEDGHCLRGHILSACGLDGTGPADAIQGTSLYTLLQMVADGLGVTLVPDMAVDSPMLAGVPVVYRPVPAHQPYREIGLAWRATSPRGAAFAEIAGLLRRSLAPLTAAPT